MYRTLQRDCTEAMHSLQEENRPRERLARLGPGALADIELLMILLGSGSKGKRVERLAREALPLLDLPDQTVDDLLAIRGIGTAKASLLLAAREFFWRRFHPHTKRIASPGDLYPLISHMADRQQEQLLSISLNGAHSIIRVRVISQGLVNSTVVHPREVFAGPITDRAVAVIMAHNHPSGDLSPSRQDKEVTRTITEAGELLGIPLLDHLIFSDLAYYSFLEEGDLPFSASSPSTEQ